MSSLFSSEVNRLFGDIYNVRTSIEWAYTVYFKSGRNWIRVVDGMEKGNRVEDAVDSLVKRGAVHAGERIKIGGYTYRVWGTPSGTVATRVDVTPRSRKGDRARFREARAAALRS